MKYAELALIKYCRRESLPNGIFERNIVWINAIFGSYCNKRVVFQGREGSQYNVIWILHFIPEW